MRSLSKAADPRSSDSHCRGSRKGWVLVFALAAQVLIGDVVPARAAEPAATALQVLNWGIQKGGVQCVAVDLPARAAPWAGGEFDADAMEKWLRRSADCDVARVDCLWLLSGRRPKAIPHAKAEEEFTEWVWRDLLLKEGERPDGASLSARATQEMQALVARETVRMPAVGADEVCVVPVELSPEAFPATAAARGWEETEAGLSILRRACTEASRQWVLQAGEGQQGLVLRDAGDKPAFTAPLGPAVPSQGEWRAKALERRWGFFWWHCMPGRPAQWSEALGRPVTLSLSGTLQQVAAAITTQSGVRVDVPAAQQGVPAAVRVVEMPAWLLLHCLSAASGAPMAREAGAPAAALHAANTPSDRLYEGYLSVWQRFLWLRGEMMGASLTPEAVARFSEAHREALARGERLPLKSLSPEEMEGLKRYALQPAQVAWMREGIRRFEYAGRAQMGSALVFGGRDPAVFARTEEGGWRKCLGEGARLPILVFTRERERRFASLLQEYGDAEAIPPRWVFGPRSRPQSLVAPRYVGGTAGAAAPVGLVEGRLRPVGSAAQ